MFKFREICPTGNHGHYLQSTAELVELLLQHAAEVYRKGQHGALAIHVAAHVYSSLADAAAPTGCECFLM